jgi:hypothetical protein
MAFPWDLRAEPVTRAPRDERADYDPDLEFYFGAGDPRAAKTNGSRRAAAAAAAAAAAPRRAPPTEPAPAPQPQPQPQPQHQPRQQRPLRGVRPASASSSTGDVAAARKPGGRPQSARSALASATPSATNSSHALGELSARRIRAMIPEELRAVCRAHSLPATGSTSEMRGRLMALLPKRAASAGAARAVVSSSTPGYRPSRQHLAAADSSHARGSGGAGAAGAAAARVRLARPIAIAQLALQDIRHRASTSLDFLRGGKIAVLLFWATGVGGGVDPSAKKWSGSAIPHDP